MSEGWRIVTVGGGIVAALGLAWLVAHWRARRLGLSLAQVGAASEVLLLGALLGAKGAGWLALLQSVPALGRWQELPPALAASPLSLQGALLGGLLVWLVWVRWRHQPGGRLADAIAPAALAAAALLALVAIPLGQFYGLPWSGPAAIVVPDSQGLLLPRWPLQPLSAGTALLLALLVMGLQRWRALPDGASALLALWGGNLALFFLGFYRGEPGTFVGPFRVEQLAALGWLLAIALWLPLRWRIKKTGTISYRPSWERKRG